MINSVYIINTLAILAKELSKDTLEKYLFILDSKNMSEVVHNLRKDDNGEYKKRFSLYFKSLFDNLEQDKIDLFLKKSEFFIYTLTDFFSTTINSLYHSKKIKESYYISFYLNYIILKQNNPEKQFYKNAEVLYQKFLKDGIYGDKPEDYILNYALNNKRFNAIRNLSTTKKDKEAQEILSLFSERLYLQINSTEDMNIFLEANSDGDSMNLEFFFYGKINENNNPFELNYLQRIVIEKGHLIETNKIEKFINKTSFSVNLKDKIEDNPSLLSYTHKDVIKKIFNVYPDLFHIHEKNFLNSSIRFTTESKNKKRI